MSARRIPSAALLRRVAAVLALFGLGGCGLFGGDADSAPAAPCPSVALVDGASRSVARAAEGPDGAGNVRYVAALTELASGCRYVDGGLEINLRFNVIAERGPALEGDVVNLPYFAATVDPSQRILSKQMFEAEIRFAPNRQVAGLAEDLTLRVPAQSPAEGAALRLYVGFQVDPAQPQASPPAPLLR